MRIYRSYYEKEKVYDTLDEFLKAEPYDRNHEDPDYHALYKGILWREYTLNHIKEYEIEIKKIEEEIEEFKIKKEKLAQLKADALILLLNEEPKGYDTFKMNYSDVGPWRQLWP